MTLTLTLFDTDTYTDIVRLIYTDIDTEPGIVCLFDTDTDIVCLFYTDIDDVCLFYTDIAIVCLFV